MLKADYKKIASYYDKSRTLSDQNTIMWLDLILRVSGAGKGTKVLDLGCGTGRFSIPMKNRLGFDVIGVDSSSAMLTIAGQKDIEKKVTWMLMDAESLAFPECSFDVVFMSHLLHHVNNPKTVLSQCHRILIPSGVVLIRYGAMEQIRDDVEHTFFPQVLEIDEQRTPTRSSIENWLINTGFKNIHSEEVVQKTYQTGRAHLEAARSRSTSVLSMISEESFQIGIDRLTEHVGKQSDDEWLLFDKMTLTFAHK